MFFIPVKMIIECSYLFCVCMCLFVIIGSGWVGGSGLHSHHSLIVIFIGITSTLIISTTSFSILGFIAIDNLFCEDGIDWAFW